jgi:hypothetical protein
MVHKATALPLHARFLVIFGSLSKDVARALLPWFSEANRLGRARWQARAISPQLVPYLEARGRVAVGGMARRVAEVDSRNKLVRNRSVHTVDTHPNRLSPSLQASQ